jgi:molybdate transport system ATP-binding protein
MMKKPKILLMDEPLSALDDEIRAKLQDEIEILHKEFNTTTIMVSHDIGEIYRLSDRVVELNNGKIINDTLTKDIFAKQNSTIKAKIINIIEDDIVLLIGKEIVSKNIDKEMAKSLKIGQIINLQTDTMELY